MTYTVKPGDSLSKILKLHGVSNYASPSVWNAFIPQLRSGNPSRIFAGETIDLSVLPQFAPQPAPQQPAPAPEPAPQTLAQKYTDPLTGAVISASEIPQFENVLSWENAWKRLQDPAMAMAQEQVAPEAGRQYNQNYRDYMYGMTGSGGQRFGRALGGVGNIKAASERDYQSQIQDWLNNTKTGFTNLWYNPSRDSWNTARTQMQPGETLTAPEIPTWDKLYGDLSTRYGLGGDASTSLHY